MTDEAAGAEERHGFKAEVAKLLHLMVHSVYSEREIFLRELVSNASDACDKLRYEAITHPELLGDAPGLAIEVAVDREARTLRVSDNGIGMSRAELVENLGTIARSGTAAFAEALTGESKPDMALIGQFGVGFYSVFMVADRVEVTSRRAGEATATVWASAGEGEFTLRPATRERRGTDVLLHLKADADEFLERGRLEAILRKYSDHVAVPIGLREAGGQEASEPVNAGQALWARPKAEISAEQHTEFYRHVSHALDEPALVVHHKAEGMLSFTALLYVPTARPFDLFDPARKPRVKLYVKRVFITDDSAELLPGWLRFVRGIVDSEDLALNISREMLQNNAVIRRMRKAVTGKVLSELAALADKDRERFETIWEAFGAVLKEGLYEDRERRDELLKLARFRSTGQEGWTSLADYVGRMKPGQTAIWHASGDDPKAVARSPQIEGFRARGVEVLLFSDPVDDFWLTAVQEFEGKPFRSVSRGSADLAALGPAPEAEKAARPPEGDLALLVALLEDALGEEVADVRLSDRLTESAACLVADEKGLDLHFERLLRQHDRLDAPVQRGILEINPDHRLIRAMAARARAEGAAAALAAPARLLLDQARLVEGEKLADPVAFAHRLGEVMEAALARAGEPAPQGSSDKN